MRPDLASAVRIALSEAHGLGLDAVLIGALASELASAEDPDLAPTRGTNDADFAVRIRDWAQFGLLKERLVARGFRPDPKIEHRLHLGESMVDLLPYGPEVAPHGELLWPVSERVMVVVGFQEACAAAIDAVVEPGLRVRRVTLPGFILLKAMAFLDRKAAGHPKYRSDAEDILYWLRYYAWGLDEARRFEIADLGISGVEFSEAGAALLGADVRGLVSPEADLRMRSFLDQSLDLYGPFVNAVVSPGTDDNRPRILRLLEAFAKGYRAARAGKS